MTLMEKKFPKRSTIAWKRQNSILKNFSLFRNSIISSTKWTKSATNTDIVPLDNLFGIFHSYFFLTPLVGRTNTVSPTPRPPSHSHSSQAMSPWEKHLTKFCWHGNKNLELSRMLNGEFSIGTLRISRVLAEVTCQCCHFPSGTKMIPMNSRGTIACCREGMGIWSIVWHKVK
jgi:hypothetical protein